MPLCVAARVACTRLLLATAAVSSAQAADLSLRGGVGLWSGTRGLDDSGAVPDGDLRAAVHARLSDIADARVDAWIYNERRDGSMRAIARFKEAVIRFDSDYSRLAVGWQIFAWGRADNFNPTDNVSVRDAQALTPIDDEQRFATPAISERIQDASGNELTLLAKRFEPTIAPTQAFDQTLPFQRTSRARTEYAIRWDRSVEGLDWSLSYFNGLDPLRSISYVPAVGGLMREHRRSSAIGADFAKVDGPWTLRGEAAIVRLRGAGETDDGAERGFRAAAIAAERSLDNSASVSGQLFTKRLMGSSPRLSQAVAAPAIEAAMDLNNQASTVMNGLSVRYAQRLYNDTLDYEFVAISTWPARSWALRPRMNYQLSDTTRLSCGLDLFRGSQTTPYGELRKNTLGFAQVSVALR